MKCVAICHDVEGGGAARSALFAAHVAHNIAHMASFLFTGPIANADGATGVGDDPRLIGSIYCMSVNNLAEARAMMEADPFMQGAWRRIDYYEWSAPRGIWDDEAMRPKGLSDDFRGYVAGFKDDPQMEGALMAGAVTLRASTGEAAPSIAGLALLRAESIDAALKHARDAAWVAAVPVAIGCWVRMTSPSDLPSPATQ